jgi:tetratricopeptide (TPR) repeat protein
MSRELRTAEELHRIQTRLEAIYGLTKEVASRVGEIQTRVDLMDSKVDEIKAMMKKAQVNRASILPWREMPMKPAHFHGRDAVVADVARLLVSGEKPRVCILGPGGIGKTSVALAVMENDAVENKFSKENCFWVPCVGATSPGLLLQILYSNLRITRDTGDALGDIRIELQASTDPRVILLDNFETPWNPREGDQKEVEFILRSLSSLPHIAILVTMRSNFPPSNEIDWEYKNLPPTDDGSSRKIYTDIDPTVAAHSALYDLLHALGNMPFAITLMATLAKKSKSSPDELLKMWRKGGTDMLSKPQEGMNHCISLSVDSKLVSDNPEALTLLATLSMLPAGTDHHYLDWWAPTLKNKAGAIATLSDAALIVDRELGECVMISVLPVVQSFMRQSDRISETVRNHVQEACYKFACGHKSSPGEPTFKDDVVALEGEETNVQAILLEAAAQVAEGDGLPHSISSREINAGTDTLLDALLAFSWYQYWSRPRVEVADRAVTVARMMKKERHLAEALFCLGSICLKIDRYPDACSHFEEARSCFRTLSDGPDLLHAGRCALALSDTYQYMSKPSTVVEKFVLEAQSDLNDCGSEYGLACGLFGLGVFYWYRGGRDEGLPQFDAAKAAFEKLDRPVDVAHCLHEAARCHAGGGRYSEALDASKRALQDYEHLGLTHQRCEALIRMARYLKMLDRDDDALRILPRSLEECQRLGSPLLIAQTLEEFGEIYTCRKDYSAARAAYEGAQEQYESMSGTCLDHRGAARCQHNFLQLIRMEKSPTDNSICLRYGPRY